MNSSNDQSKPGPRRPLLLNVTEAADALGVSKWGIYQLINQRELRTVRIGSRRLVPVAELDVCVERLVAKEIDDEC
jgi:excisionase family DNA binding protein